MNPTTDHPPIILFDGVCGLCDRFVAWVLKADKKALFRFSALQGETAGQILAQHQRNVERLKTVVLVLNAGTPEERLLIKSDAVLEVWRRLDGFFGLTAALGKLIPRF